MTFMNDEKNYLLADFSDITPTPCPCGQARRAFTREDNAVASMHVVDISADSRAHYHKKMTEIYYVLEGTGRMELDGEEVELRPGKSVLIRPGCVHRAVGNLKILNVPVPAFDPKDEWFED